VRTDTWNGWRAQTGSQKVQVVSIPRAVRSAGLIPKRFPGSWQAPKRHNENNSEFQASPFRDHFYLHPGPGSLMLLGKESQRVEESLENNMSASAIERKLAILLRNKETVTEADVVYVLVEIVKHFERKAVEEEARGSSPDNKIIRFFRDWAVHGTINHRKHAQEALKLHEEFGPDRVYDKMFSNLMQEITGSGIVNIPEPLKSSFKESLLRVIEDVPIEIMTSTLRLTATSGGSIMLDYH
jgi:hypothetical protein